MMTPLKMSFKRFRCSFNHHQPNLQGHHRTVPGSHTYQTNTSLSLSHANKILTPTKSPFSYLISNLACRSRHLSRHDHKWAGASPILLIQNEANVIPTFQKSCHSPYNEIKTTSIRCASYNFSSLYLLLHEVLFKPYCLCPTSCPQPSIDISSVFIQNATFFALLFFQT